MQYPEGFPPESRAAVAAEKLRAGEDFDRARENPQRMQSGFDQYLEAELRSYILRPFIVFVREACRLGQKGIWHVDRIEEAALEFLRLSTIDAVYNKGRHKSGEPIGHDWTNNWNGGIQPAVQRAFERSPIWKQYEDLLLGVAETQAAVDGPDSSRPATDPDAVAAPHRRAAVDSYIQAVFQRTGKRITRAAIWKSAGYKTRTEFERWERGDSRATKAADRNFTRILSGTQPLR
jgi:hypothetical protein